MPQVQAARHLVHRELFQHLGHTHTLDPFILKGTAEHEHPTPLSQHLPITGSSFQEMRIRAHPSLVSSPLPCSAKHGESSCPYGILLTAALKTQPLTSVLRVVGSSVTTKLQTRKNRDWIANWECYFWEVGLGHVFMYVRYFNQDLGILLFTVSVDKSHSSAVAPACPKKVPSPKLHHTAVAEMHLSAAPCSTASQLPAVGCMWHASHHMLPCLLTIAT